MNIVLIGFMGTGKSAVGQALARHLGAEFLDTDAEIERKAGKPIRHIFADDGEAAFRGHETSVLERLAAGIRQRQPDRVIATGGGVPLRPGNDRLLRQIGTVVWLTAPAETILARVGPDLSVRPLLAAFQDAPQARIESLLADRRSHYEAIADFIYDTSRHATPEEVAARLADHLCQPVR